MNTPEGPRPPSDDVDALVELLDVEPLDDNFFRGQSQDPGWGRLYGGHVLAQAMAAAQKTVPEERLVHSIHGSFLLTGDVSRPVLYAVDRIRDGGSFTTRRVVALQNGRAIFHLSASFQSVEPGFDHHDPRPDVPPPHEVRTLEEAMAPYLDRIPKRIRTQAFGARAFELRPDSPDGDPFTPEIRPPTRNVWLRARGPVPDRAPLHSALLAYISDYFFLGTSLLPHGVGWMRPDMQVASLDHSIWFHDDVRVDDWLLYAMHSPRASRGRGLVLGHVYAPDGRLVATCAQEGLIRQRPAP